MRKLAIMTALFGAPTLRGTLLTVLLFCICAGGFIIVDEYVTHGRFLRSSYFCWAACTALALGLILF